MTTATESSTDQHLQKASSALGDEPQYPLLLPKGVVLKLKPGSKRFSRKAWPQKRPLVQKPLLIQPSPSVQPVFNPGKMATWPTQSEVPPSNTVVQIPHLIQPAAVLQTLPGFPSVGVRGEDGFESPTSLPATPCGSEARTSFPLSETQSAPPSCSAPKLMLPSLAPSEFRKPYVRWKPTRRKGAKASPCVKPAPVIHLKPVIFTVPATTVKVVSLGGGCNMIQPVSAAVAPSPQTIPITTFLVNPTTFPCSLNQPLVASSISPLIVSSNPLTLPVTSIPEDKAQVKLDVAEGKNAPQNPESKLKPQELTPLCTTVFSKEEPKSWHSSADTGSQEAFSESSACSWAVVKTESQEGSSEKSACGWTVVKTEDGGHAVEPLPQNLQDSLSSPSKDLLNMVKMEAEDCMVEISSNLPKQDIGEEVKEERSMELDSESPQEKPSSASEMSKQTVLQREDTQAAKSPSVPQDAAAEGRTSSHASRGLPKSTLSSMGQGGGLSGPPGKLEDSANADGQSVGTPAGPDTGGEKDGPEEEEEEDFDDLTQDEEDELSSASEESVLSVPELQVRASAAPSRMGTWYNAYSITL